MALLGSEIATSATLAINATTILRETILRDMATPPQGQRTSFSPLAFFASRAESMGDL
jgi:hypothetical protein